MAEPAKEGAKGGLGAGTLRLSWWLAAAVALAARLLHPPLLDGAAGSTLMPSASVLALLLGMVVGALPGLRHRFGPGAALVARQAIPIAIVCIGFGLDLQPLLASGQLGLSFALVILGMLVAFGAAMLFGRLIGLDPRASMLLGAGTAVCGNSAILAVAPTVDARDEDVGLAVGVVNLLGVLMVLTLPPALGAFGVTGEQGGALAGLTVHAVPQSIAAGEAFGSEAAILATVFKLLRVMMLAPVVWLMAFVLGRSRGGRVDTRRAGMPWFALLFAVASGIRALGWVDGSFRVGAEDHALWQWIQMAGNFLLAIALAAVGVSLDARALVRVGPRMLVAGTLAVVAMVAALIPLVRWLL